MKRLLPFLFSMALIVGCSPEEFDISKPDISEELKTASVITNNIPDGLEGDSVYIFTLDNKGEFYSATQASAVEDGQVKTATPPGNASFTIIAYIPTVSDWTIEDAFDQGWYSAVVGATDRNGRYITNDWDQADNYDDSNQSGASSTLEVDLLINGGGILLARSVNNDYDQGDILTLEADVDNNTLGAVTSVVFSVDGNTIETVNEEPYEINFNTIDLTPGTHVLSVVVNNEDGDEADDEEEIVILVDQNEAPDVNITGLTNGATYIRQSVRTINSNASDPEGDLARVEFKINGSLVSTVTEAPYTYTWDTYDNQVGAVTVEVIAYDDEGAERSDFVNVTLEAPENYSPRVSISNPSNGANITIGTLINIGANTSDDEGDAIGAVYFYFNGSYIGQDTEAPYTFENFDTSGYTAGEYTLSARVYNEAFTQTSIETITVNLTE